jgi:hypothetical protein
MRRLGNSLLLGMIRHGKKIINFDPPISHEPKQRLRRSNQLSLCCRRLMEEIAFGEPRKQPANGPNGATVPSSNRMPHPALPRERY